MLLTWEDREELFSGMGFERRFPLVFSKVREIPDREFVLKILFEKLSAKALYCGEDFRFGAGAKGDTELLAALCRDFGRRLEIVPAVKDGGEKISSSRIRRLIAAGDVAAANRLLGRPFGFKGEVVHGNRLGTGMGTPTINMVYPKGLVEPKYGVYAAWCRFGGEERFGVCNIGVKPTVGSSRVLAETWLPGFEGDLYGKAVRLFLIDFIRAERKFSSLEELKDIILQNAGEAKMISERNPLSNWDEEELLP